MKRRDFMKNTIVAIAGASVPLSALEFIDPKEVLAANPAAYVAPPPPPPPTPTEIDAEIEAITEDVMNGTDRDMAFGMLLADMWRAANPGMTVADARIAVRARFKSHLETLRKG